jgi:DnaJ-domain-containing protein 1
LLIGVLLKSLCAFSGIALYIIAAEGFRNSPEIASYLATNNNATRILSISATVLILLWTLYFVALPLTPSLRAKLFISMRINLGKPSTYLWIWVLGATFYHFAYVSTMLDEHDFVLKHGDIVFAGFITSFLLLLILAKKSDYKRAIADQQEKQRLIAEEKGRLDQLRREAIDADVRRNRAEQEAQRAEERRKRAEAQASEAGQAARAAQETASKLRVDDALEDITFDKAFTILGIAVGSSTDQIKEAYRARMREYHPDTVATRGEKIKQAAEKETKRINRAYEILRDHCHF